MKEDRLTDSETGCTARCYTITGTPWVCVGLQDIDFYAVFLLREAVSSASPDMKNALHA
jgi:hypothetical protein